jgi:hypothetical protein
VKCCGRCHEWKPLDQFVIRNPRTGGRKWCCNACSAQYCREHYWRRKDRYIRQKRVRRLRYAERNRQIAIDFLMTHPCVDCGEIDILVLEFDHIGDNKRCDVSALVSSQCSARTLKDEIAKCVVRCANCHRRKTARERGWFKANVTRDVGT